MTAMLRRQRIFKGSWLVVISHNAEKSADKDDISLKAGIEFPVFGQNLCELFHDLVRIVHR
jgi:hypothetical protein